MRSRSSSESGEAAETRAAGADSYLTKPICRADLYGTLTRMAGRARECHSDVAAGKKDEIDLRGAQVLLAELRFSATAFGAASNGAATANAITADASANNTGTATWFRIVKADGTTHVLDGNVGTSGSDLNLTTTSIVATQPVSVTSFVITEGNA